MTTAVAEGVVKKNPEAAEPSVGPVVEKPNQDNQDKPEFVPPTAEVVTKNPDAAEPPLASVVEKPCHVVEDKPVVAPPPAEAAKPVTNVPEPVAKKSSKGSLDRDIALAKLEGDKKSSYIKASEENEKSKVENKAQKKLADIASWENTKKASLDAQLRKLEEKLEKKKAYYAESVKNKVALIHKQAEEKRAMVEAARKDEIFNTVEAANTYRATKQIPKKSFGCF
ncbi:remorin-like [Primulina eburnea]|uniref:remorin-like n=1 Tax=Primulina eburnea TaxID=1245227 RepID=UPI003C6CB69D